jgi:hypothetical protein
VLSSNLNLDFLNDIYKVIKKNKISGADRVSASKFLDTKDKELKIIYKKLNESTYKISTLKSIKISSDRVVFIPTIRDKIVLELLKERLDRIYKINYADRNSVIDILIQKLESGVDYTIVKLDIKDFFSSIPQNEILHKIRENINISLDEYNIIKQVIKKSRSGLPQGLAISNVLAEMYIDSLDFNLKHIHNRINYYCRYVDDILIIINGRITLREETELRESLKLNFKKLGLKINESKTNFLYFPHIQGNMNISFNYLGYKFYKDAKRLNITISDEKLNKFFNKIDKCFSDYIQNQNFNLLLERLKLLTCCNKINKRRFKIDDNNNLVNIEKTICFGMSESYKCINDKTWEKIDCYIKTKIYRIKQYLDRNMRRQLFSLSSLTSTKEIKVKYNNFNKYTKEDFIHKIISINPGLSKFYLEIKSYYELAEYYFNLIRLP